MVAEISDVIRISVRLKWNTTDDITNVMHFVLLQQDEPNDTDFMSEVADEIDILYAVLAPHQASIVSANIIEGKNITQDLLLPATVFPAYTGGSGAGGSMAPQVCPMSYFPTIKPRTQGRIYWPPLTTASNTNGALGATALDDHDDVADLIHAGLTTATIHLAYIVYNVEFGTWVAPSASLTQPTFRTQRRRRAGVGS